MSGNAGPSSNTSQGYRSGSQPYGTWTAPHASTSFAQEPTFTPHWDAAFKTFFQDLGLLETLRGFELDFLVLNPEWEQEKIPSALKKLTEALSSGQAPISPSIENRKLDYVRLANGSIPVHPTTLTKSISQFLAQSRARNDASNRAEFLLSAEEKRALRGDAMDVDDVSCARTDAKYVDRNQQIQYDIAKNDTHLRRTTKKQEDEQPSVPAPRKGKEKAEARPYTEFDERVSAERYPGLDGRLTDVETHLAVHYVPSPPLSLLTRLKLVEDHIIRLEKEYPPWAALHFNQPNRDWPPPPPSTPLIVPHNVAKVERKSAATTTVGKGNAKGKSSLHRAVMDRLEIQKAMKAYGGREAKND